MRLLGLGLGLGSGFMRLLGLGLGLGFMPNPLGFMRLLSLPWRAPVFHLSVRIKCVKFRESAHCPALVVLSAEGWHCPCIAL
jgi:hypothetical protein